MQVICKCVILYEGPEDFLEAVPMGTEKIL